MKQNKKIKKWIILLLAISIFSSCKNERKEIVQYDRKRGMMSKWYINEVNLPDSIINFKKGIIVSKLYFKQNHKTDCYAKLYDDSKGKLMAEGNYVNKIKDGKWKYYDSKIRMRKIADYKNICNKSYPNQEWGYDEKGKLNPKLSVYFTYAFKNSRFKVNEPNALTIEYVPTFKKGSVCRLKFAQEIDSVFCNIDTTKMYSFIPIKSSTFNIPLLQREKGTKHFRGYIEENSYEDVNEKGLIKVTNRRIYVDIPIIVE